MTPNNTAARFPIMASFAQSGKAIPTPLFCAPSPTIDLATGVRLNQPIGARWGTRRTAQDVAPMPDEKTKAIIKEKIDALLKEHDAAPRASNAPHAPTLAAFHSLAMAGTLPPKRDEISSAALAEAGLHPETFFTAYLMELSLRDNVLAPVPDVDERTLQVSALTGKACAQIMRHRYGVEPTGLAPESPQSPQFMP